MKMTMEEALKLKAQLIEAGLSATVDGRSKTICLHGVARYSIGGFTGTVEEAVKMAEKETAANKKAAEFNARQPSVYTLGCAVNGDYDPKRNEVRKLVPGDLVSLTEYSGGSRRFRHYTIKRDGVVAVSRFGRTTSGKARTRWTIKTASGEISEYC